MIFRRPVIRLFASTSALVIVFAATPISADPASLDAPKACADCCFLGATPVLMTAGKLKVSEVGDQVMNRDGAQTAFVGFIVGTFRFHRQSVLPTTVRNHI